MRSTSVRALVTITAATLVLTACSGGGGASNSEEVVTDGTFKIALSGDPGSLDPQSSITAALGQMNQFLYDPLVNDVDGKIVSSLAKEWVETENTIVFTLQDGITCADGSALTASDVAANINYVGDAANLSPIGGFAVPLGTTAVADDTANTVVLTTPAITGFLLNTLPFLPIVCASGLEDRASLGTTPAGTGPYTLTNAVPGASYSLERRDDYVWGPSGDTTATAGVPKNIEVTVGANFTTTANELLAGGLNAGSVFGPDASRLEEASLVSSPLTAVLGEVFYNQNPGRATADPAVRKALTQALDFTALREVAGSGTAEASKALTGLNLCKSDLSTSVPQQDTAAATSALKGVTLPTLKVTYFDGDPAAAAAAELVVTELASVGVKAETSVVPYADITAVIFQNADFDIALYSADGTTPTSVTATFSGPTPPNGGQNFANIDNEQYDTLSQQAMAMPGTTGCDLWNEADTALVTSGDVIPFASGDFPVWGSHATFTTFYARVLPTTIRMQG